jgi:dUTP pyrophosphatase
VEQSDLFQRLNSKPMKRVYLTQFILIPMFTFLKNFFKNVFSTNISYTTVPNCPNILSKAHESDACYDLQSNEYLTIKPGCSDLVKTGIYLELPRNWEAQVRPRSGMALKYVVTVLNSPGTIDAKYRGELAAIVINHGKNDFKIEKGDRIAQIKFERVPKTKLIKKDKISLNTERGEKGFGSSGK